MAPSPLARFGARWRTITAVALSGLLAASLAFLLHEVLGHGAAAWFLGGRFLGFFISPTAAFADTATTPGAQGWVTAAGTPVNLATGTLAYLYLQRHARADRAGCSRDVALWQFAHVSLLLQLSYLGELPLFTWLSGQAPQGDWGVLFSRIGVHPVVAALVALPLGLIAATSLARAAAGVTPWPHVLRTRWRIVKAYATLTAPPLMLTVSYALIELPWTVSRDYFEFLGLVTTPLTIGLAGAAIAEWRYGTAIRAGTPGVRPLHRAAGTPLALMLATPVALGLLFGPTIPLRRGVAVQRPTADDYTRSSQDVLATITPNGHARATLVVVSETVPARGSPYVRRLTQQLAGHGPSAAAAAEFTQFFAERNLGATFSLSEQPRPTKEGWRWAGLLQFPSGRVRIQIWPSIYREGSRITGVTMAGAVLRSDPLTVKGLGLSNGAIVWRRPDRMEAPVEFILEIP